MTDFLLYTRRQLEIFPRNEKIQASKVIDHIIEKWGFSVDAVDVARSILYMLSDMKYLTYEHNLFTANMIIFHPINGDPRGLPGEEHVQ